MYRSTGSSTCRPGGISDNGNFYLLNKMAVIIGKSYRRKHATAAAMGGHVPAVTKISFGSGGKAWDPDDIALESEVVPPKAVDSAVSQDLEVIINATLSGGETEGDVIQEIAYWDAGGGFVAREVIKPKEFEAATTMRIEAHLMF